VELERALTNPHSKAPEYSLKDIVDHLNHFVEDEMDGIESRLRVDAELYQNIW
jgi:hypothetical protein